MENAKGLIGKMIKEEGVFYGLAKNRNKKYGWKFRMTGNLPFKTLFTSFLILVALTSCMTPRGGGGGWPVSSYAYGCTSGFIPSEPFCLMGEIEYRDEFQACRQSLLNYTDALDRYYNCSAENLKSIFDQLLVSVPAKYNCYVEFFENNKEGDSSVACPPIDVPRFSSSMEADGLEYDLGVPRCIRKSGGYTFAPKKEYELHSCEGQVEVFTGKGYRSYSSDASSAQGQHDTFLRNLRQKLDREAEDAVRKFNCRAEGDRYCF
jgi:hypothetical protein